VNKLPLLFLCLAGTAGAAGFHGLPLQEALEQLRANGLELYYSSDLIKPWMRVEREPRAIEPKALLSEILAPYGITYTDGPGGSLLLVRRERRAPRAAQPGSPHRPAPAPLTSVVVSASHYLFGEETPASSAVLTAAQLEMLPDIGEDPLLAVSRLPGVARQDFSSRVYLRGGTDTETLVRFDDLRLYNPYHLKDFFGAFSTIDPGIISDIRVYTGGFPVNYGDRSSGVVDIAPRLPGDSLHGQALLSLFTTGVSAGGSFAEGAGDWAFAARRGNMDVYLDLANSDIGKPKYHDFYAHVGRRINDWLAVSANSLLFDDRIIASDNDQEEEAVADYRDQYHWLRFDLGAPDGLGGRVLVAHTRLESERIGTSDLPGVGSGMMADQRRFTIRSLQADGWWRVGANSLLQAGAEWRQQDGWYRYQDEAEFELLFLAPGAPARTTRARAVTVRPSGHQAAAYLNWRYEPSTLLAADLGLRWDTESLATGDGSHWSPRTVVMWRPREDTRLRLGWGRYYQAQAINELQVPDGERRYQPAQRATHLVASIEHDLTPAWQLRGEVYRKDYDRPFVRHENLLNTLVVLPELKPDRILIAPDSALAEGVELSLNYEAGELSSWISYTHSRVRDRIDGEWLRRSWDQRNYLSAGLNWHDDRWELAVAASWHQGWPTTPVALQTLDPIPLVEVGRRNTARISNYLRFDLRVARRFQLESAGELSAFLEVSNLFNRPNDCCVEYQLEGEEIDEIFLDAESMNAVELIPSVGVVWKF